MSINLNNIQIRVSPLSNRVMIVRFGKDKNVALDTRDAMNDFLQALVQLTFDGKMPEVGQIGTLEFGGGNENFVAKIERVIKNENIKN